MTRRAITVIALLCVALAEVPAAAQVGGGVKAGLALSTFSYPGTDEEIQALTWRPDVVVGGFVVAPAKRVVSFQAEGTYGRRGARADFGDVRVDFRLTYLEISGLLRIGSRPAEGPSVYAYGGVTTAFTLGATQILTAPGSGADEIDVAAVTADADFRISVGGGVEIRRFLVEGRYTQGLRPLFEDSVSNPELTTIRTRAIEILAGVRF